MAAKEYFYPNEDKFYTEEVSQSTLVQHVVDALNVCPKDKRVFVVIGLEENDTEEMERTETLDAKLLLDWL